MPAGTLTLTNNSAVVKGAGTAFNTELKAGDMIVSAVGGVTYTLPVKSVDSATQVTLIKAYNGPTQAGAAWYAVPRDAMNLITAQLAAETAKALRGLNLDKDNWQQVFSGTGNITVTLPDGSKYTGPAWNSFTAALNLKAEKKTVEDLASEVSKKASQSDVDTLATTVGKKADADKVINKGAYGLAVDNDSRIQTDFTDIGSFRANAVNYGLCSMRNNKSMGGAAAWGLNTYSPIIWVKTGDTYGLINIPYNTSDPIIIAGGSGNSINTFRTLLDNTNTTIDANGFVKKASPIVKLFGDGSCEVNEQSVGVTSERVSEGVYRIFGTLGFNSDAAWSGSDGGISLPKDRNDLSLLWVDYEVEPTGDLLIKTYHREHLSAPEFARNKIDGYENGALIDVPNGRWLDLRVEMPTKMEKSK